MAFDTSSYGHYPVKTIFCPKGYMWYLYDMSGNNPRINLIVDDDPEEYMRQHPEYTILGVKYIGYGTPSRLLDDPIDDGIAFNKVECKKTIDDLNIFATVTTLIVKENHVNYIRENFMGHNRVSIWWFTIDELEDKYAENNYYDKYSGTEPYIRMWYPDYALMYNDGILQETMFQNRYGYNYTTLEDMLEAARTNHYPKDYQVRYTWATSNLQTQWQNPDLNINNFNSKMKTELTNILDWFSIKSNRLKTNLSNSFMYFCLPIMIPTTMKHTKTYTNSTWSTSKTWYILVKYTGSYGSNVVNYVTMIRNNQYKNVA